MKRERDPGVAAGLRFFREAKKLTREQAADISGYSPVTIKRWERMEFTPSRRSLQDMATTYGVTVDQILTFVAPQKFLATRVSSWPKGRPCDNTWELQKVGA